MRRNEKFTCRLLGTGWRKSWRLNCESIKCERKRIFFFSLSFNFALLHAAHLLTLHNVHLHFWIFYAGSIHHPFTFIVTLSKSSLAWFMALLKNACCGCLLRDANENLRRSAQGGSGKFILHGIVLLMQGAIGSKYLIGIRGYARLYVCCRLSSFAFFYAA